MTGARLRHDAEETGDASDARSMADMLQVAARILVR